MLRRLVFLLGVIALLGMTFATTATATEPTIEKTRGNPKCEGTKIDPVTSGTYALVGGGHIVITVVNTPKGPTFNFDTEGSATVDAVLVKGGPYYHVYIYPDVESDTGLHAPLNSANQKWYGLSHLCIESVKKS
jgi:hypothetical protein